MAKIKNNYECALILSNDLIGGKWKLRILWHIIHGDNRFSLLEKTIPDITTKVLASQIKELEDSNILHRNVVNDKPPKTIYYEINKEYDELIPIIESVCIFSKKYALNNEITIKE